jgi:hypothetical protein
MGSPGVSEEALSGISGRRDGSLMRRKNRSIELPAADNYGRYLPTVVLSRSGQVAAQRILK